MKPNNGIPNTDIKLTLKLKKGDLKRIIKSIKNFLRWN